MNNSELIVALFAIGFMVALAAFFIMWAKYDEQKKLTQEERDKRWDEISRAESIEKEKGKETEELESEIDNLKWDNDCLTMTVDRQQDKLSAILCLTNNHVWKDGVCVKCGRMQDE